MCLNTGVMFISKHHSVSKYRSYIYRYTPQCVQIQELYLSVYTTVCPHTGVIFISKHHSVSKYMSYIYQYTPQCVQIQELYLSVYTTVYQNTRKDEQSFTVAIVVNLERLISISNVGTFKLEYECLIPPIT